MSVERKLPESTDRFTLQSHLSAMLFSLQSGLDNQQLNCVIKAIAEIRKTAHEIDIMANRVVGFTAMMKRLLGEKTVELELPSAADKSSKNPVKQLISHWTRTDLGRIVLVGTALLETSEDRLALLKKIYDYSDNSEKRSIIVGLNWLLSESGLGLGEFIEEIQRTNALDIFTALVLDNPLPAKLYGDGPFNQMVLKSLFQNLPIDRIKGLQERRNAELNRMCDDYLHERRLAGREIPASLWLALSAEDASEQTRLAWQAALTSDAEDQRYYAARALQHCLDRGEQLPSQLAETLASRVIDESHPTIKTLVQDMQS